MNYRKTTAFITALVTCFSSASLTVSESYVYFSENTVVHAADVKAIEKGMLGPDVSFEIFSDGNMVVSGHGEITETTEDIKSRDSVVNIVLKNDSKGCIAGICDGAFFGMGRVAYVEFSEGLESIGKEAFMHCNGLKEVKIPDTVCMLGERAFAECAGLQRAEIGSGIGSVIPELFNGCRELEELTMPVLETLYTEGSDGVNVLFKVSDMFEVKDGPLTDYAVRKINIKEGAREIPAFEFWCMETLTEVNIPAGVEKIGKGAFADTGIEKIVLPEELTEIGEGAFAACRIDEINLPEGLESIGKEAFMHCNGLKEVKIPDTVCMLGERAFAECTGLQRAEIGSGIGSVIPELFNGCRELEELTMPVLETLYTEGSDGVNVLFKVSDMFEVKDGPLTDYAVRKINIKEGAKEIPAFEFFGIGTLTEVNIPAGIEKIGKGAFANTEIEKIVLPEELTEIGEGAFAACRELREVYLPEGLESIGREAFAESNELSDVYFAGKEEKWKSIAAEGGNEPLEKAVIHFGDFLPNAELTPEEAEKFRGDGDVDGNGIVDLTDLTYIALYKVGDMKLSETALIRADLTKDGTVNLADLATLKMILAHAER